MEPPAPAAPAASRRPLSASRVLAFGLLALGALLGALGGVLTFLVRSGHLLAPLRESARFAGSISLLLGLALATAGAGIEVFAPVRRGRAAAAAGFGSHRVMLATTAFATLLALLLGNTVPLAVVRLSGQRDLHNLAGFLASALSVDAALLSVVYFRFLRPGVVALRDFGVNRNRLAGSSRSVWLAHLASGLGGGLLIMVLSYLVQALLGSFGVRQTQLDEYGWVSRLPPTEFWPMWLAVAVAAPVVEEVFFRGIVFRAYLQTKGPLTAYLVSAALFAVLHLNLPALLPILVLALVLAALYHATGSLVPCVLAHGFNNGVAFLVLYASSHSTVLGG